MNRSCRFGLAPAFFHFIFFCLVLFDLLSEEEQMNERIALRLLGLLLVNNRTLAYFRILGDTTSLYPCGLPPPPVVLALPSLGPLATSQGGGVNPSNVR